MFIFSGCTTNSTKTGVVVNNISLEEKNSLATGETVTVHCLIDVNGSKNNVGVFFSLVPKDEIDIEDNASNIAPDTEYDLGAVRFDLNSSQHQYDANVTIPLELKVGDYHLVALLDNTKSTYPLTFGNGDVFVGKDIYSIDRQNTLPDPVIESFTVDDDVLLLSRDKNGTFDVTTGINSKYYASENISIHVCLEIDEECIDLSVLSPDGTYGDKYMISKLSTHTTHFSLTLQIPPNRINEIVDKIQNNIYPAKVVVELDRDGLLTEAEENNNKSFASVSLYDAANLTESSNDILSFEKKYSLKKHKKKFGTTLTLDAKTAIGTENAYAYAHGDLLLDILGHQFNFFHIGVDTNFQYDSFDDTGITRSVTFMGYSLQDLKDMKDNIKSSVSEYKDIMNGIKNIPSSWNTTKEELKKVHLVVPPINASLDLKKKIASINLKKINAHIDVKKSSKALTTPFSIAKSKGYSEEFLIAIVPVDLEVGAGGEFGYTPSIGVTGIMGLVSSVDITAKIDGYASAGVGMHGFEAGAEGAFAFVEDTFSANTGFALSLEGNATSLYLDGKANLTIDNHIIGPNGSFYLFAKYTKPKICAKTIRWCVAWNWHGHCTRHHKKRTHYPCGIEHKEKDKYLFDWKSFEKDTTLLDIEKPLVRTKLY